MAATPPGATSDAAAAAASASTLNEETSGATAATDDDLAPESGRTGKNPRGGGGGRPAAEGAGRGGGGKATPLEERLQAEASTLAKAATVAACEELRAEGDAKAKAIAERTNEAQPVVEAPPEVANALAGRGARDHVHTREESSESNGHPDCLPPAQVEEEVVDSRVEPTIEKLNRATDDVNNAERELWVQEKRFASFIRDSDARLASLRRKNGKHIAKALPYYTTLYDAERFQEEAANMAMKFETTSRSLKFVKASVTRLEEACHGGGTGFDPALQDALNNAVSEVMELEKMHTHYRIACKRVTHLAASQFQHAESIKAQRGMAKSIQKAASFYETKRKMNEEMVDTQTGILHSTARQKDARSRVNSSLISLEELSTDIHNRRGTLQEARRTPSAGPSSQASSPGLSRSVSGASSSGSTPRGQEGLVESLDEDLAGEDAGVVVASAGEKEPSQFTEDSQPLPRQVGQPGRRFTSCMNTLKFPSPLVPATESMEDLAT